MTAKSLMVGGLAAMGLAPHALVFVPPAQAADCPKPAVVLQSEAVVPVTKANFAAAETQTVFARETLNSMVIGLLKQYLSQRRKMIQSATQRQV